MRRIDGCLVRDPVNYGSKLILTGGPGTGAVIIDRIPTEDLMHRPKHQQQWALELEPVYRYCVGRPWARHTPVISLDIALQTLKYLEGTI